MSNTLLSFLCLLSSAIAVNAQDFQKQLQTQLILSNPGDTIVIPPGKYFLQKGLIIDGKKDIVLTGSGMEATILNFSKQEEGAEGIKINQCHNLILKDLTVEDAKGDCIKALNSHLLTFYRVRARWTGKPSRKNGAYAIYPVSCTSVLIDECIASGASDAGIYVGQSDVVEIRNCETMFNVAGIEVENTTHANVHHNYAHDNTGGILIFDLPELPKKKGGYVYVHNNRVIANNYRNFAPKGNIVGQVPPGTGLFVLATPFVEISDNLIQDNKTVSLGICSYYIAERPYSDSLYNPYPSNIIVRNNSFIRKKAAPDIRNKIGMLLSFKFGKKTPHIVYDGITGNKMTNERGELDEDHRICIRDNANESFANLDASNGFRKISFDLTPYRCDLQIDHR